MKWRHFLQLTASYGLLPTIICSVSWLGVPSSAGVAAATIPEKLRAFTNSDWASENSASWSGNNWICTPRPTPAWPIFGFPGKTYTFMNGPVGWFHSTQTQPAFSRAAAICRPSNAASWFPTASDISKRVPLKGAKDADSVACESGVSVLGALNFSKANSACAALSRASDANVDASAADLFAAAIARVDSRVISSEILYPIMAEKNAAAKPIDPNTAADAVTQKKIVSHSETDHPNHISLLPILFACIILVWCSATCFIVFMYRRYRARKRIYS